jgi:hypothetical protein
MENFLHLWKIFTGKTFCKVVTFKNCWEVRGNIKIDLRGIVCKERNSRTDSRRSDWFEQNRSSGRNKRLNVLQLKDGKHTADLTIQLAGDLLPPEISSRVINMVQKCRSVAEGKWGWKIQPGILSACFAFMKALESIHITAELTIVQNTYRSSE